MIAVISGLTPWHSVTTYNSLAMPIWNVSFLSQAGWIISYPLLLAATDDQPSPDELQKTPTITHPSTPFSSPSRLLLRGGTQDGHAPVCPSIRYQSCPGLSSLRTCEGCKVSVLLKRYRYMAHYITLDIRSYHTTKTDHSLITQASDTQVRPLRQEENTSFTMDGPFDQTRPSRPELRHYSGYRSLSDTAICQVVIPKVETSPAHLGPVMRVCSPFSTCRSKLRRSSSPPRSAPAAPPAGATIGTRLMRR